MDGFLALVRIVASVAGKGDMLGREEYFVDPYVVLSGSAASVFLVGPAEGVFTLGYWEDHLAPVEGSGPFLHQVAVDVETQVVAIRLAVCLSGETDFIVKVFHIILDAQCRGGVVSDGARLQAVSSGVWVVVGDAPRMLGVVYPFKTFQSVFEVGNFESKTMVESLAVGVVAGNDFKIEDSSFALGR